MKKRVVIPSVKNGKMHPKVLYTRKVGTTKIKVAVMPKKMKGGWIGSNKEANRELGIKSNLPYNEICYYPCRKKSTNRRTKQHELIEEHLIRYGKLGYPTAHKVALKFEDTRKTPAECLKWYKGQKHK